MSQRVYGVFIVFEQSCDVLLETILEEQLVIMIKMAKAIRLSDVVA